MNRKDQSSPSRRQFLVLGAGAFAAAAIPFALSKRRGRLVRRQLPIMGTIAEFAVVHDDRRLAHAAIDAAFDQLRFVDEKMSRFRPGSDVGRINRADPYRTIPISRETATVLEHALAWAERSDGAFDPCLGRATELWDVTTKKRPPAAPRFEHLAGRRLYHALDLDHEHVRVRDDDVKVDLGGIAKGYAVDRAANTLRERGVENALVNVGGDLVALGRSEDGDRWHIGVTDPADPTRIARTLDIEDEAVATSGDYRRFFDHGGRRYHHLLDPDTGAPRVARVHSVTVVANDCLTADAAATACFLMDEDKAHALLRGNGRIA